MGATANSSGRHDKESKLIKPRLMKDSEKVPKEQRFHIDAYYLNA